MKHLFAHSLLFLAYISTLFSNPLLAHSSQDDELVLITKKAFEVSINSGFDGLKTLLAPIKAEKEQEQEKIEKPFRDWASDVRKWNKICEDHDLNFTVSVARLVDEDGIETNQTRALMTFPTGISLSVEGKKILGIAWVFDFTDLKITKITQTYIPASAGMSAVKQLSVSRPR